MTEKDDMFIEMNDEGHPVLRVTGKIKEYFEKYNALTREQKYELLSKMRLEKTNDGPDFLKLAYIRDVLGDAMKAKGTDINGGGTNFMTGGADFEFTLDGRDYWVEIQEHEPEQADPVA